MLMKKLTHYLLLPELEMKEMTMTRRTWVRYETVKRSQMEYCPRCASPSDHIYDHRTIVVKDAPIRDQIVFLSIKKRRLWCSKCQRPFTEPVPGIRKGSRTTERYKKAVTWACENFSDLERVQRTYRCSAGYLFKVLYRRLEERHRMRQTPWPTTIGIDEHSFRRRGFAGGTEFATMFVDYSHRRILDIAQGKNVADIIPQISHIQSRENVKQVIVDLCDPFKKLTKEFFPNALLIADKFHVLRLLTPSLLKRRKQLTGTRAEAYARRLLTSNGHALDYWQKNTILQFLKTHPDLRELYQWKERLHGFYRIGGYFRAYKALKHMLDDMSFSLLPEIRTLRKTLLKWKEEILNYFSTGLTNGRTEGYNNLAKLVQRRAFGYKNFNNYRLRLLNACY